MKRCPVCGGINEDSLPQCKFCGTPLYFVRSFITVPFGHRETVGFRELLRFSSLALISLILSIGVLVPFFLFSLGLIPTLNYVVGIGALASASLAVVSLIQLKRGLVNFSGVRGVYKVSVGSYMTIASTLIVFVLPIIAYPVLEVFALPSPIDFLSLSQSELIIGVIEIFIEIFTGASIVMVGIGIHDIGSTFKVESMSTGGLIMAVGGALIPIFYPLSIILGITSLLLTRAGAKTALRRGYATLFY
ncbi:hypothetical protein [Sulfuracidifex tepidarius]|uniref:Uncharacterized protein n=1 Tax=Sulfuracidifex tepidarius TaxID=1294262 RepID=A0A510DYL4_9CREN|nr:hypothetical protein [Sulfuracidifex tepidarius]BBG25038.1 hypothetical protein IC006_2373 [Sulfuracidifex tepidarius]BBG27819.1 hypothetical protein IC007_2374 [Sulfuracidifex tepidarius]